MVRIYSDRLLANSNDEYVGLVILISLAISLNSLDNLFY